jgi:hypothetical protein
MIPQAKGHVYGTRNMCESIELIERFLNLIGVPSKLEGVIVEFGSIEFLGKIGVKFPEENGVGERICIFEMFDISRYVQLEL